MFLGLSIFMNIFSSESSSTITSMNCTDLDPKSTLYVVSNLVSLA